MDEFTANRQDLLSCQIHGLHLHIDPAPQVQSRCWHHQLVTVAGVLKKQKMSLFFYCRISRLPDYELALTLKTDIFSVSMKVPLLSLVATETDELKGKETRLMSTSGLGKNVFLFHNIGHIPRDTHATI